MKKVLILMTAAVLLICAGNTMKTSAKEMKTAEVQKSTQTHLLTALNTKEPCCAPACHSPLPPTVSFITTDNGVKSDIACNDDGKVTVTGLTAGANSGDVPIPIAKAVIDKNATGWNILAASDPHTDFVTCPMAPTNITDKTGTTVVALDTGPANISNNNTSDATNESKNAATVLNKDGTNNLSGGSLAMVVTCTTGFNLRC